MIKRLYEQRLLDMLAMFPVVAVVGPRQVGKSTLVLSGKISRNRQYASLDDLAFRTLAQKDPVALVQQPGPITVDEVQLAPELLRAIKQQVDRARVAGRYLITGSAELNYCADLSHVLAGRVAILRLPPITLFEERGMKGIPLWVACLKEQRVGTVHLRASGVQFDWKRIVTGGFPLSLTSKSENQRALWMESFRSTYLERDLRRISDIGHLSDFSRLMELSAVRTGQVLNQAALARDAGLSPATAGRYLSILEASFLIERVAPYYENIGKRMVKAPKLYWQDTGLACHLLGLGGAQLPGDRMAGALFETFVVTEIQALLPIYLPEARLHYVRTHDGLEVDGLVQLGRSYIPLEIKAAQTVTAEDARPIQRWMELTGHAALGLVLYAGQETRPLGRNVWAIPITATVAAAT